MKAGIICFTCCILHSLVDEAQVLYWMGHFERRRSTGYAAYIPVVSFACLLTIFILSEGSPHGWKKDGTVKRRRIDQEDEEEEQKEEEEEMPSTKFRRGEGYPSDVSCEEEGSSSEDDTQKWASLEEWLTQEASSSQS